MLSSSISYSKCSEIISDGDDDNYDDGNKHEGFMNRLIYRPLAIGSYF